MSKLREEMIRAMKLRNFSNKTQGAYLYQIMKLAGHYGRSPDQLTHKELQDYLIYMKEKLDLSFSSCNVARSAIRFLYGNVLKDDDIYIAIPAQRTPRFLPEVLSVEEVMALINATTGRLNFCRFPIFIRSLPCPMRLIPLRIATSGLSMTCCSRLHLKH